MMRDYDVYLFDWDGTLAKTLEIWITELHLLTLKYGLTTTYADTAKHFGEMDWASKRGLPEDQYDAFQQELLTTVQPKLLDVALYDDVLAVLERLHGLGKKIGLVTTSWRGPLNQILEQHPALRALLDSTISGDEVANHKPHPEGILTMIGRFGVPKDRVIMLGDTDKDIVAAHGAGVDSVLFYPESHEAVYELAYMQSFEPTRTIRSWQELLDQLQ